MKKIMKRLAALAAVSTMTLTALVGCATTSSVDNSEVVATIGDSEVTAGVANFYLRYQQSGMEALYSMYFGENFWTQASPDGTVYGDSLKADVMDIIHEFYLLEDHMADYNVTLSEDDLALIDKSAADFVEANSESTLKNISGDVEVVKEVLRLFAINERMFQAITADVDREISDDEAAQKKLRYYSVSTTKSEDGKTVAMSEEEIGALTVEMKAFLAGAKETGSMEEYAKETGVSTYELTFDKNTTTIPAEVIEAADALKEGEFTDIVETEYYYFIAQLESEYDEEATKTAVEEKINEIESAHYSEVVEKWMDETTIEEYRDVIKQINVSSLKVLSTGTDEEE